MGGLSPAEIATNHLAGLDKVRSNEIKPAIGQS